MAATAYHHLTLPRVSSRALQFPASSWSGSELNAASSFVSFPLQFRSREVLKAHNLKLPTLKLLCVRESRGTLLSLSLSLHFFYIYLRFWVGFHFLVCKSNLIFDFEPNQPRIAKSCEKKKRIIMERISHFLESWLLEDELETYIISDS